MGITEITRLSIRIGVVYYGVVYCRTINKWIIGDVKGVLYIIIIIIQNLKLIARLGQDVFAVTIDSHYNNIIGQYSCMTNK